MDIKDLDAIVATPPMARFFETEAEYEEALKDGKIDEGQMCVVAAPEGPKFTLGTDGTIHDTFWYKNDFEEGGVTVNNLKTETRMIEKALFESFKRNCPESAEDWDTLLRINNNDYEITLRQIMEAKQGD
jgi:hypothetical protein